MKTILFAGGGTLGPVTPLLAVASRLHELRPEWRFAWAGTDSGPERSLVEQAGIPFATIPVAKFPRHLTWKLFTAPFDYLHARREASRLIEEAHPSLVIAAGGFTAVPVILEAAGRRIPCITHQLDYVVGMSNRMIASHCRYVTTSFDYPEGPFGTSVVTYRVPTPTRFSPSDLPSRDFACRYFGFDPSRPVVLVTGGGTGAKSLNESFAAIRSRLPEGTQILHLTGRGKSEGVISEIPNYIVNEFLGEEMLTAYAAADIVVSRAGTGAISECAVFKKAMILVPLPDSPQEANAAAVKQAVRIVSLQAEVFPHHLLDELTQLLQDSSERQRMGESLHTSFLTDRGDALATLAISVLV